jgi:hypothetical protein
MRLQPALLLFFVGLTGCQTIPLGKISDDQVVTGEFPAVWIGQINYAYKDFLKAGYDPNCFKVALGGYEERRTIEIYPPVFREIVDGVEVHHMGAGSPCGQGMNYHFDATGQFIRKTYNR